MTARNLLIVIALSFALFGALETTLDPDIWMLHMILLALLGFAWCKADVRGRGIDEPRGSALLVGGLGALGVPIYFFRSRPARAAWLAMLRYVAFAVLCVLLYRGGMLTAMSLAA